MFYDVYKHLQQVYFDAEYVSVLNDCAITLKKFGIVARANEYTAMI